ncbi:hypothetical protein B0J17DRAFT_657488 [Rhizoctonia solani]|nr:hypothetical protein B0J17DRAFT_657488 [Rhizoctonia solani]
MRVAVRDPQIEPDARDWYNKLVLLKDAAEDNIGDAPTMEDVAYALNKILPKPSTDNNPVDNTYIARLEELFTLIDDLRFDSEEHNQLTEHLAMRQNVAWGGVRRALMQLIQDYRLTCARDPTITEVINAFCCNTGSIISNAPSVDSSRWLGLPPMAASILVGNAMIIILSTLLTDKSRLPLSEKITLFLTLVPATMKSTWESVKEIGAYITEFLPPHLGRLLSSKAMTVINGASELWSKVGITVSYVVGVILAGICAWNAFNRFHKMWKDGETVDKLGAGWDVLLSASFSAVTIYRSVAVKSGASASVLAWCGALSGGIVITAAISSLVFAAVKWCPRRDPIAAFITNYGGRYGLLRQSGR